MPSFTIAQGKAPKKPSHVIILSPSDFSDKWPNRPVADVAVGLVRVSDLARQLAEAAATRYTRDVYVKDGKVIDSAVAVDAWNAIFIREAMAVAMVNPNDVTQPYFPAAQEVIAVAMTPQGIAKVWAEYHLFLRRTDKAAPKIEDEEAQRLAWLLNAGRLGNLDEGTQGEVRRLLFWCLAQLGTDDVEPDEEPADDVYVVNANG